MPYQIRKLPKQDLYRVSNRLTGEIHSNATSLDNAKKQVRLLHMIDHQKSIGKGLEENNISVLYNMPNKWVEHCRQFAKEKGIKYSDALKHPDCKKMYGSGVKPKSTLMRGKGVIDETDSQAVIATAYNDSELGANAGKKYISL